MADWLSWSKRNCLFKIAICFNNSSCSYCCCIGFVGVNELTEPIWAEGAANGGELFWHQVYSQKHWELPPKNHGIKRSRKAYSRDANGKIIRPTQTNIKKSKKIKDK